jgi:integrase
VRFVPHFNMLEENNVRRGFLQDEQYLRLSGQCAIEGVWLAGLFETAYAYGWREDELLALRVGQLDLLAKIIDLGKTKNGDPRMIVMTENVFQHLVRCVAGKKADEFVFTHDDGSQVKDFRGAWWNACIRAGLGRFLCRECEGIVSEGRKCLACNSKKKAKYIGLHFHDLRRTGIRNMSRKGIPEKVGMLISGHRTDSVYRRYNIIDMEVIKEATAKIEEHQRALKSQNSHRTAIANDEIGADDKTDPVN